MGKFRVKGGKKGAVALEIVPKDPETEVLLPASRKSDDKPLTKVAISNIIISNKVLRILLGKMDQSPTRFGIVWSRHQLS